MTQQLVASKKVVHELPIGWRWVKLGEVCEFLDSRRIPINENERNQRIAGKPQVALYPYYGANGQVGWIDDYLFDEPLILLAEDGGFFGSHDRSITYAVSGKYWVNNHAHVLKPKPEIDFDYCLHVLRIRPDVGGMVAGATRAKLNQKVAADIPIPLPPKSDQLRIAKILNNSFSIIDAARAAAEAQLDAAKALSVAFLRDSLTKGKLTKYRLGDCLSEVKNGVGKDWEKYPVLGATRAGLAAAKDPVGKKPERYKLVNHGTVFYNPMRILLGSIAMVDQYDEAGITSPDYVAVKGKQGILDTRWFYYFFRSVMGEHLIKTLVRGAVRERILFKRLAKGEIELPSWERQVQASKRMFKAHDLINPIEDRIREIDALPSKYLKLAFSGEL